LRKKIQFDRSIPEYQTHGQSKKGCSSSKGDLAMEAFWIFKNFPREAGDWFYR
jgi:hypothetical protein